ncbi:MAG: molybdopterin molybdotransferase MoeA [Rhodothermales bacterium]
MITVQEADLLLAEHACTRGAVSVPLTQAVGRVLREDVAADRDYPPFDRVAMDGIAVASAGLEDGARRFRLASTQAAGEPPHTLPETGACIEIMTGAALAEGCDTVVRYEDLDLSGGWATLRDSVEVEPKQNVHVRGSDRRAGEPVLEAGTRLRSPDIAALASIGKAEVRVAALPQIAVVTTGDEVVAVDAPVLPHQIRESNGPAVRAALHRHGYPDVQLDHVPDDEAQLRHHLGAALDEADVLVLSGGVSAGKFDLVPKLLDELGVREVFHKIRQKPGKPLWFGTAARGQAVFGLPGNPVSALVCLYRYVLPFLAASAGETPRPPETARLARLPRRKNDFTLFVPARREGLDAHPVHSNGSGDFLSLLASDGFAEVAAEVEQPSPVPFYSWSAA